MSTIIGASFVGPIAARFAFMLVACAGLVLVPPTPDSRDLDASIEPHAFGCQTWADSSRDHEWKNDVNGSMSDACDDDDDGDDESSSGSGPATFGRAYLAPDFSISTQLTVLTEGARVSRVQELHLLRGPPALPMESSTSDDTTGTYHSIPGCGVNRREPHLSLLRHPFHSASAQPDYDLRAPP